MTRLACGRGSLGQLAAVIDYYGTVLIDYPLAPRAAETAPAVEVAYMALVDLAPARYQPLMLRDDNGRYARRLKQEFITPYTPLRSICAKCACQHNFSSSAEACFTAEPMESNNPMVANSTEGSATKAEGRAEISRLNGAYSLTVHPSQNPDGTSTTKLRSEYYGQARCSQGQKLFELWSPIRGTANSHSETTEVPMKTETSRQRKASSLAGASSASSWSLLTPHLITGVLFGMLAACGSPRERSGSTP